MRPEARIPEREVEQVLHGSEFDWDVRVRVVQERAYRAGERRLVQRSPREDGRRVAEALHRRRVDHRWWWLARVLPPGVADDPDDLERRSGITPGPDAPSQRRFPREGGAGQGLADDGDPGRLGRIGPGEVAP